MPDASIKENLLSILGEEDIILGFKAMGFDIYAVKNNEEFRNVVDKIAKDRKGICLVQENFYKDNKDLIEYYKNLTLPVFIPFSKKGEVGLLNEIITDIRLRAIGVV